MKSAINFEELLPWFGVSGYGEAVEQMPPGGQQNGIIRTDQSWYVRCGFSTTGALNYIMCGDWKIEVLFEKYGKEEFELPNSKTTVPCVAQPYNYYAEIMIPANVVPPGVYDVVTTIDFVGKSGHPGPITGFCKLEGLRVYTASAIGASAKAQPNAHVLVAEAADENGR